MKRLTSIFALILLIMPIMANAKTDIGQTIPTNLQLSDQNSKAQNFETLSGQKGLVLVFVRSADWCPYCQVQLLDLNSNAGAIVENGYNIVTLSYDSPKALKIFADKYSFPFTMLSDTDSKTIKAFGILNQKFAPDHFAYGVPHPHIYVIGNDKTVQAVLSEDSYKKRPQISAIKEAIGIK